jgi:iron-sulfur cluster assembly protein
MGFDDNGLDEDTRLQSEGIDLVISKTSEALLTGMTLDYVEIEPGKHQFIFMNPNDPNYKAPEEDG